MTKDNIGLAALLEIKQEDDSNNKQMVLICTAHIHWDPDYCDVKLIQTLMLTNEIKMIIEQAQREFRPHQLASQNQPVDCSSTIPVVICADLNSLPESGVIEYLRTGKILANHVDFKELGYDSCLQKINTSDKPSELSHNLKLDCAYDKEITPYTNYTLVFTFLYQSFC
jgi:CCR4-NOT transcription complex subunit 6